MRSILQKRSLRFVFAANVVSMLGSGMNSAAVAWTILQRTHSEMALGTFAALQTIPAMLMLPFTGVIIDREDRRRLVMWLDAGRAVVIFAVMVLAFLHRVRVWELYLMNTLVAAGFWMFWPTITAVIQELTPEGEFVQSNTFLLAGVRGGRVNGGWGVGAFLSALYAPALITRMGARISIALSMLLLTFTMALSPFSPWLALAVVLYGLMGSARGVSGVAMNTGLMEQVPPQFMGRVQNTFYFFGTFLQVALGLAVGWIASRISLAAGFGVIAAVYAVAFGSACWPMRARQAVAASISDY